MNAAKTVSIEYSAIYRQQREKLGGKPLSVDLHILIGAANRYRLTCIY